MPQAKTHSHRHPTFRHIHEWVQDPIAYRFEYADGTRATMLLMNGLIGDFTFAAKLKDRDEPLSTLFSLPPNPNVADSMGLMAHAETTLLTGKSPCPIERPLLTTGLIEAASKPCTWRFATAVR